MWQGVEERRLDVGVDVLDRGRTQSHRSTENVPQSGSASPILGVRSVWAQRDSGGGP